MMPHSRLASVTASVAACAITNVIAKHLAKPSPSVAINRGTQEKNYIQPLFVHNSPTVTREAVAL